MDGLWTMVVYTVNPLAISFGHGAKRFETLFDHAVVKEIGPLSFVFIYYLGFRVVCLTLGSDHTFSALIKDFLKVFEQTS